MSVQCQHKSTERLQNSQTGSPPKLLRTSAALRRLGAAEAAAKQAPSQAQDKPRRSPVLP